MTDKIDWDSFEVVDTPQASASSVDWDSFEVVEDEPPESASLMDRAKDVGISALKGAFGVTEAVVGLYDMGTGGRAGKFAEENLGYKPKEWKAALDAELTPEQQAANQAVGEAEGFSGKVKAAVENPSAVGHTIVESIPLMAVGGLAGRGIAAATKAAPWLAGAAGEGVAGAGAAAESIRQGTDDGTLTLGQTGAALASGAGTAAFGAAGGRIAQKLGISDVDTLLAGGGSKLTGPGVAKRILAGGISEGAFEELPQSAQEQIWQNAALDRPLLEGVPEAAGMGLVTGAAMGGAVGGAFPGRAEKPPTVEDIQSADTVDDAIAAANAVVSAPVDISPESVASAEIDALEQSAGMIAPEAESIAEPEITPDLAATQPQEVAEPELTDIIQRGMTRDEIFAQREAELQAQEEAAREQGLAQLAEAGRDQQVEQAEAITQAQGFDAAEPTAMQLAMQAAQQRRKLKNSPISKGKTDQAGLQQAPASIGLGNLQATSATKPSLQTPVATRTEPASLDLAASAPEYKQPESAPIAELAPVLGKTQSPQELRQVQSSASLASPESVNSAPIAETTQGPKPALTGIKAEVAKLKALKAERDAAKSQETVVDRYLGRYGKGMSEMNAKTEMRLRAKRQPAIEWRTEPRPDLGYDRFEVVGYQKTPASDKISVQRRKEPWQKTWSEFWKSEFNEDDDRHLPSDYFGDDDASVKIDDYPNVVKDVNGYQIREDAGGEMLGVFQGGVGVGYADRKAVVVSPDHQKKGLGRALLATLKERFDDHRVGSHTPAGGALAAAFHRESVRNAIASGKKVPAEVLANYPDLTNTAKPQNIPDRRKDAARRKAVAEMSQDEMRKALLTSELTGLGNKRAYTEVAKKPFQASIDIDSLKWINDNLGHEAGDQLIKTVGTAMREEIADAYHLSGDEFAAQFDDEVSGNEAINRVRERLKGAIFTYTAPDGTVITKQGAELSYGIADTYQAADERLKADKAEREARGERAGRGAEPAGVVRKPAAGRETEGDTAAEEVAPRQSRAPAGAGQSAGDSINVDGVERSRTNSEGRPIAASDDALRNFWRWFGDSKVVDADGKPLIVYHGTTKDFTEFDPAKSKTTGIFFSSTPDYANVVAELDGAHESGAKIIPAYVRVLNQMYVKADEFTRAHTREAKENGHDGLITLQNGRPSQITVFASEQIKSATGNIGTFDPSESSILKSESAQRQPRGLTAAEVTKSTTRLRAKWIGFTKINTVQSVANLPASITDHFKPDAQTEGFYDQQTKSVYLIADNIESPERAVFVASHEVVGHGGLRMLRDKSVNEALNLAGQNRYIRDLAAAIKGERADISEQIAIEEAIAETAAAVETGDFKAIKDRYGVAVPANIKVQQSLISRIIAAVKRFMAVVTGKSIADVSDADVRSLIDAQREAVSRTDLDRQNVDQAEAEPALASTADGGILQKLAQYDEIFRVPKSDKDTVEGIAADVDSSIQVKKLTNIPGETRYNFTLSDGRTARMMVRRFNPYGNSIYGFDLKDGEMTALVDERPGRNAEEAEGKDDVWIDVSLLDAAGGYGATIYSIAANYAHNTGRVFIGDPAGLSDEALIRRPEQMLSSALKFGTTEHIAPHPRQIKGDKSLGVGGLDWVYGDDLGNIKKLIDLNIANIENNGGNGGIEYDQSTGQFTDGSGNTLTREDISGLARAGLGRKAQAGGNTLARSALLKSLIQSESGQIQRPDGVLAALRQQLRQYGAPDGAPLKDIFYSKAERDGRDTVSSEDAPRQSRAPSQVQSVWDAPEPSKLDDVIRTMQNKMVDTKRVVAAIRESIANIADKWDPYLQEELFHGRSAKQVKQFQESELRPLVQEMQMRKIEIPEFEEYLHMRHAEERNNQIAKVNPDMQDGGSGVDTADARAYLANLPANKKRAYEALAKRVDAINKNTRQLLISAGLETAQTVAAWEGAYQYYVPLQREEGGSGIGQGFSVRGSASKRATGSKKDVINILGNLVMQRERTIVRAEKNRVATALYGLAIQSPNPDFWLPVNPEKATQKVVDELVNLGLNPIDAQNLMKEPTQTYIDPRTGLVAERVNPFLRSANNVMSVRVGGQDRYVFFNENDERAMRMVTALKNLDADQLGRVLSMLAKVTRYFSAINTQYNPIFGIINLTRDTQGAMLNLSTTPIAGKQKEVVAHTASALRGIYIDLRDHRAGKKPTSSWATLYEEFQREGGQTGYRDMFSNSQARADALQNELNPDAWMDSRFGKLFTANGTLRVPLSLATKRASGVFNWLSDYNETMENAVRLAAYKVGKEQGMSNQRAASMAKNLTVNFNRKGQIATQAGALYAFFNAAVQGTARLHETLFKPGTLIPSATGAKIIAGGLLLGSMQALVLAAAGFDDEEPPEFVKSRSIVIPTGGGKYISIPMPLGFNLIPSISRLATEFVLGGFKEPTKKLAAMIDLFADTFNPIGNAGLSLQTIAPTAIDPLAALSENRDWTGKPIAKESMSGLAPTPGHMRAKDTASAISKTLSYWMNAASGGTKYQPGLVSPTPDQLDYLIGQATGGVGREALKVEQTVTSVFTGEELPSYKVPLLGRLYGDTTGQAGIASKFYDNLKTLNAHEAEIKGRRKDRGDAVGYIRDNPEARLFQFANAIERDVQQLRRRKRDMLEKDASKERIKYVEAQITSRMKRLNDRVRELREKEAAK